MPSKPDGVRKKVKKTRSARWNPSKRGLPELEIQNDDSIKVKIGTTQQPNLRHEPCLMCKPIRQAITSFLEGHHDVFEDFKLGPLGSLAKKTTCPIYQSILKLCQRWLRENQLKIAPQDLVTLEQSYNSQGDPNPTKLCINIEYYRDYPPDGPELNFIALEPLSPRTPHGRLIDSQWIDVGMIRRWIDCCDSWHAGHCHSLPEEKTMPCPTHVRLIDVEHECLVRGSPGDKYVALSYVWGSVNNRAHQFHTTEGNLQKYEQEGMLTDGKTDMLMPQTVKDAMRLTLLLGQRYLWVDCFCIVQDNPNVVDFQINQMGSIFANACFTIIAADGVNADRGLGGIEGWSVPRQISQEVFEYAPGRHLLGLTSNMVEFSTWNKRGWTFQEKLFSRRKLVLSNGMARWMCHCTEWSEDVAAESESVTGPDYCEALAERATFALRHTPDALFTEYSLLVNEYGETELTRGEDVLAAFSGITSTLSRTFPGGFHYGLPEMFFDLALLWQPRTSCTRRTNTKLSSESSFPSWSWAGWKGGRGYAYLGWAVGCAREEGEEASWDLKTTVDWHKVEKDGNGKARICNSSQEYQLTYLDISKPLPQGWTRHQVKRKGRKPTSPYYTHTSDPDVRFRFPVPMRDPNEPIQRYPEKWTSYLSFHTSRCSLMTSAKCLPHPIPADECLPVSLRDSHRRWAGALLLNTPSSKPAPPSFSVDLIAISEGWAKNDSDQSFYFPEWDLKDRPKDGELYEFVNVLWVEWEDGIAHRKGLGRVMKDIWEKQKLEWVDVMLG